MFLTQLQRELSATLIVLGGMRIFRLMLGGGGGGGWVAHTTQYAKVVKRSTLKEGTPNRWAPEL